MSENILCVKNIKKSFGGVHALKGVDLTIKKGETHCLAGENGCGKSTIIKVISGFYKPDEGTIEIDGKEYTNMSTADAIAAGIQVIYQDFSIFPASKVTALGLWVLYWLHQCGIPHRMCRFYWLLAGRLERDRGFRFPIPLQHLS